MLNPRVYLCGTITPSPVHLEWRKVAEAALRPFRIDCLSPVRGKDPSDWQKDGLNSVRDDLPYAGGGFVPRDYRDIDRCDALLLMFTDTTSRQSIGTWMEAGYAVARAIPIVVVSQVPTVIGHPFIQRAAAKICPTLEVGVEYLKFLLS